MSTRLLHRSTSTVLHAVTHPVSTLSFGVGVVRGAAAAVLRAASGGGGPAHAEWIAPPEPVTEAEAAPADEPSDTGTGEEHAAPALQLGDHLEPAPEQAPGEPGEPFVTEPSAVTRESAHGGSPSKDELLDDWYDADADDDQAAGSVIEALEIGDTLPSDGPDEKSILREAEILRSAADPERSID